MEQRSEQNVCILVVDDEQDIRRIIRILLESSGYQVAEAPNGLAAVEYIRQQPNVDLVLMDIMMPGLTGIEASRAIRERCSAPILFLTAKTQERDKLEAYQAGGDDYLAKPFGMMEFIARVRAVLRRAGKEEKENDVLETGDLQIQVKQHQVALNVCCSGRYFGESLFSVFSPIPTASAIQHYVRH